MLGRRLPAAESDRFWLSRRHWSWDSQGPQGRRSPARCSRCRASQSTVRRRSWPRRGPSRQEPAPDKRLVVSASSCHQAAVQFRGHQPDVDPLPDTYADFTTEYAPAGSTSSTGAGPRHHRRTRRGQCGDLSDAPPVPAAPVGDHRDAVARRAGHHDLEEAPCQRPLAVPDVGRTEVPAGGGNGHGHRVRVPASTVLAVARAVKPD